MPTYVTRRRRPKIGDVIEIRTPRGLAYAQYTHKHPMYGALLRVLKGLYNERPVDFSEVVKQPELFNVFFPLGAAVHRDIVTIVAHEEVPDSAKPFPLFRVAGMIDHSGHVRSWFLWDGEREWYVGQLTPEQRQLPELLVVNDTALIEMILEYYSVK